MEGININLVRIILAYLERQPKKQITVSPKDVAKVKSKSITIKLDENGDFVLKKKE